MLTIPLLHYPKWNSSSLCGSRCMNSLTCIFFLFLKKKAGCLLHGICSSILDVWGQDTVVCDKGKILHLYNPCYLLHIQTSTQEMEKKTSTQKTPQRHFHYCKIILYIICIKYSECSSLKLVQVNSTQKMSKISRAKHIKQQDGGWG